jgi:hypothetical protein
MEMIIKMAPFVIGLIGVLVAVWRFMVEMPRGRQGNLRDEYKFFKDFLSDLKAHPDMHPFLMEKGYQAVSGGAEVSGAEMEYILQLHGSVEALRKFVSGRRYLDFYTTRTDQKIKFKRKYLNNWTRFWRKWSYAGVYFTCSSIAVSPLLLPGLKLMSPENTLVSLILTLPVFFPIAIMALRAAVRINNAESLIKSQVRVSSIRES